MAKKNNKRLKLIIAGIVIAVVVVFTLVPALKIGIGMSTHQEPYIRVESYEELKEVFSEEESFLFPDMLLKKCTYKYGQASTNNDGTRGYELVVDNNEGELPDIKVTGVYTKYIQDKQYELMSTNVIYMNNVEIKEMYCDNDETDDTILYQFELDDIRYVVMSSTDKEYSDCIQEDLYPNNQELLDVVKMLIEQHG